MKHPLAPPHLLITQHDSGASLTSVCNNTQADSRIKQACTCWCGKHLPFPPHKACVCQNHRWETVVLRSHPDPPPVKAQKGYSGQDTGKRVSCNHLSITSSPGCLTWTPPGSGMWAEPCNDPQPWAEAMHRLLQSSLLGKWGLCPMPWLRAGHQLLPLETSGIWWHFGVGTVRTIACLHMGQTSGCEGPSGYTCTGIKFTLNFTHVLKTSSLSSLHQPSSLSIAQWGGAWCKDRTSQWPFAGRPWRRTQHTTPYAKLARLLQSYPCTAEGGDLGGPKGQTLVSYGCSCVILT